MKLLLMVLMHGNAAVELSMLILELCYFFYQCYWATGTATDAPDAATATTGAATAASAAASGVIPNATPISSHVRWLLVASSFFCYCITVIVKILASSDTAYNCTVLHCTTRTNSGRRGES